MSTIIIVLLVIVLVVAIVLKKRADNENTATPKKGGASKPQKKVASKKSSKITLAREEQEAIQQTATPISESLRQKIELEIVSGNFQAVEAQINQLLKQDNSQHELYLFLLDIHLAQKDDFAIDQLIKHINALKLDDIVQIAETKQREYQKNKQPDAIEFSINSKNFHQVSSLNDTKNQNNDSDFDSLTQSNTIQSFDDLQSEFATPTETEKDIEIKSSIEPLDFSFSFEQKETAEPVIEIETKSSPEPELTESKDQAPLEFSFNLEPTTSPTVTEQEVKVEETKSGLDFSFADLELKTPEPETKTEAPDRKSTRLNSSHSDRSRMPSSA